MEIIIVVLFSLYILAPSLFEISRLSFERIFERNNVFVTSLRNRESKREIMRFTADVRFVSIDTNISSSSDRYFRSLSILVVLRYAIRENHMW